MSVTVLDVVRATPDSLDLDLIEAQRDRLLDRLRVQRIHAAELWQWYEGRQPLPSVASRYAPAYKLLLELSRTPWARLVVDAIAERLHVSGFRSGNATPAEDEAAWNVFRDSSLDADEWLVYTEALITGVGYVSVSQREGEADVTIAPESAFEVTHEPEPGNRRDVAAALKLYPASWTGTTFVVELYRPEATYVWLGESSQSLGDGVFPIDEPAKRHTIEWQDDDPFETPNSAGIVPVVPFENRATVLGGGVSELEDCVSILRRIDKLTLDKLMTSEFASFRQRWATGLEVPRDETGNPVEPFSAAVSKLWVSENPETKFGSFDASDLDPYLKAIDADIAALAAISRVPAHYLIQSSLANPPSAESLLAGESGLVAKVRERQRRFGESWEQTMRLAFALSNEPDFASDTRLEVVWTDAEMRNPAQVADAAVKLQSIGVPQEALWEYIGATPQQIADWTIENAAVELRQATPPEQP